MLSIELPITATFFAARASLFFANSMNSVVHTGVKSAGCENRMIHLSFCQVDRRIGPWVVLASKSGAGPLSSMRGGSVVVMGAVVVIGLALSCTGTCAGRAGSWLVPVGGAGPPSAHERREPCAPGEARNQEGPPRSPRPAGSLGRAPRRKALPGFIW